MAKKIIEPKRRTKINEFYLDEMTVEQIAEFKAKHPKSAKLFEKKNN